MNRFNMGNIVTNGMQILSVGATTAARTLGRADTALNNQLTETESGGSGDANKMQNNTMQKQAGNNGGGDVLDVDKIMEESGVPALVKNSEEVPHIQTKEKNDLKWLRDLYELRMRGSHKLSNQTKSIILKRLEGEDTDADV